MIYQSSCRTVHKKHLETICKEKVRNYWITVAFSIIKNIGNYIILTKHYHAPGKSASTFLGSLNVNWTYFCYYGPVVASGGRGLLRGEPNSKIALRDMLMRRSAANQHSH